MTDFGKLLIVLGAIVMVAGIVVLLAGRLNLPLGRLPGDIAWRSKSGNTQVYFPIVTSIVLSIVLSLIFWVIGHFRR